MTKKIPISFNGEEEARVQELANLMGIAGVYGDFPKAVKFGINFTLSALKNPHKVYSDLDASEIDFFLSSVKKLEIKRRHELEVEKHKDLARKV